MPVHRAHPADSLLLHVLLLGRRPQPIDVAPLPPNRQGKRQLFPLLPESRTEYQPREMHSHGLVPGLARPLSAVRN